MGSSTDMGRAVLLKRTNRLSKTTSFTLAGTSGLPQPPPRTSCRPPRWRKKRWKSNFHFSSPTTPGVLWKQAFDFYLLQALQADDDDRALCRVVRNEAQFPAFTEKPCARCDCEATDGELGVKREKLLNKIIMYVFI